MPYGSILSTSPTFTEIFGDIPLQSTSIWAGQVSLKLHTHKSLIRQWNVQPAWKWGDLSSCTGITGIRIKLGFPTMQRWKSMKQGRRVLSWQSILLQVTRISSSVTGCLMYQGRMYECSLFVTLNGVFHYITRSTSSNSSRPLIKAGTSFSSIKDSRVSVGWRSLTGCK